MERAKLEHNRAGLIVLWFGVLVQPSHVVNEQNRAEVMFDGAMKKQKKVPTVD